MEVTQIEPDVSAFIESCGVEQVEPESGFQAGVHQIRNFEKAFSYSINPDATIADIGKYAEEAMRWLNEPRHSRVAETRRQVWERGVALPNVLNRILDLDGQIADEQRRAEQSLELRKRDYGAE